MSWFYLYDYYFVGETGKEGAPGPPGPPTVFPEGLSSKDIKPFSTEMGSSK